MAAFVDNDVPVVGYEVLNLLTSIEALDDSYVDLSRSFGFASSDLTDLVNREIEEHCEALAPLITKLLAMDQYQCIDGPFGNQPS